MKYRYSIVCIIIFLSLISGSLIFADNAEEVKINGSKLAVVWSSGDPDVANSMVFMYTYNAKKLKWFDKIKFIVWGPSAKLLSQDEKLQKKIKMMDEIGIELYACKACADSYNVSEILEKLGINVKYYGKDFTELIKSDWKVITF
jgi:hypothetical protein